MEILRGARSDKDYNTLHEDFLALPLLKMNDDVVDEIYCSAQYNAPLANV